MVAAATACASAGKRVAVGPGPGPGLGSGPGLMTTRCCRSIGAGITVDRGAEASCPSTIRQRGAGDSWLITVAAQAFSPSAARGNIKQNNSSGKSRATGGPFLHLMQPP